MSGIQQRFSIASPYCSITSRAARDQESCFEDDPGLFMFAMLCVLISTGTALLAATTLAVIPVSTTQTVLGAIVGSTLAYKGSDCVVWYNDTFPWLNDGLALILVTWILAPSLCMVTGYGLFSLVRQVVLRAENPFEKALVSLPFFSFFTMFVFGK